MAFLFGITFDGLLAFAQSLFLTNILDHRYRMFAGHFKKKNNICYDYNMKRKVNRENKIAIQMCDHGFSVFIIKLATPSKTVKGDQVFKFIRFTISHLPTPCAVRRVFMMATISRSLIDTLDEGNNLSDRV